MNARDELAALLEDTHHTPHHGDEWLRQHGPDVLAMYDEKELLVKVVAAATEENLRLREALQAADVICRKYESENERLREQRLYFSDAPDREEWPEADDGIPYEGFADFIRDLPRFMNDERPQ